MEYTACVDRLEQGVLVFVCDGGEVFTAPHSLFPNLKEGQRCVLTVKAEQVTAAKASACDTRAKTEQVKNNLHRLFKNSR